MKKVRLLSVAITMAGASALSVAQPAPRNTSCTCQEAQYALLLANYGCDYDHGYSTDPYWCADGLECWVDENDYMWWNNYCRSQSSTCDGYFLPECS